MESFEQDSYSYYHLHEKIAIVSLLEQEMRKNSNEFHGNFSCVSSDTQSIRKQDNINNNNNAPTDLISEQTSVLQFYVFDVSRERNLHLSTNSNDKRLINFHNISNGLHKLGIRNGDVLIFLNENNILKPPVALTLDRIKSELSALRRKHKKIQIGICRASDRSSFNNSTVKHLSSFVFNEFENLSHNEESDESRKSASPNTDSKKLLNLFSNRKKAASKRKRNSNSARDSGFIETDGDHSLNSNSNPHRSKTSSEQSEEDDSLATHKSFDLSEQSTKQTIGAFTNEANTQPEKPTIEISPQQLIDRYRQCHLNFPTEVLTDACFIYRRQIIKKPPSNAIILRGREIAYQAAHATSIPSSMPNYTQDQIRELYGELDKKTRRLHDSILDEQCPLPKFRIDKEDSTLLRASYLSTGLSNPRAASSTFVDTGTCKDSIRGSFRTSIADRTSITPSPHIFNLRVDFNNLPSTNKEEISSSLLEDILQTTSIHANIHSNEKQSETLAPAKEFREESQLFDDKVHSTTSTVVLSPKKNYEVIDVDHAIDLDDETTISYHATDEYRSELDACSLISNNNHEISKIDHERSALSFQTSAHNSFTDNLIINEENIDTDLSIDNIINMIHDLNQKQSKNLNHYCFEPSIRKPNEPISFNNFNPMVYQAMAVPSEELVDESFNKMNPIEAIFQQVESLVKKSIESKRKIDKIESNCSIFDEDNSCHHLTTNLDEDFDAIYQDYLNNLNQYQIMMQQIEKSHPSQHILTPISEESTASVEQSIEDRFIKSNSTDRSYSTITVKRQSNHIGHYGFELEQSFDGKIIISTIIDSNCCPNLKVGDEIISINNSSKLTTIETCYLLFHSLWHSQYQYVQIIVNKSSQPTAMPASESVSLESSSLSWPLSIAESDFLVEPNLNIKMPQNTSHLINVGGSLQSTYVSQIAPRATNVQRRAVNGPGVMTRMYQSFNTTGGSSLASIAGLGNFSGIPLRPNRGSTALVAVNETREREKRELCQLNDKFAQYVEKVRFLEAQNRKLQLELDALQKKAGHGSSKIKEMYEIEMSEARKLIEETTHNRATAEAKAREAEKTAGNFRKRYDEIINSRETDRSVIDRLQQQIAENEAQIGLFRRRLCDLEDEAKRYKAETQRLASEIARLQNEIQNETFMRSSLDTEKMALEDELAMLKQTHEAALLDLHSKAIVDVKLDPSQFFRNELAQAIRDIRQEFETLNEQQRADLHNRYMISYNEFVFKYQKPTIDPAQSEQQRIQEERLRSTLLTTRNEVAHMKAKNEELNNRIKEIQSCIEQERVDGGRLAQRRANELEELRTKLIKLQREYEEVINMKTSLEKEISTYRDLLEGTNNREGLKQIVDHVVDEARRLEVDRIGGSNVAGSLDYAGSAVGGTTTVRREFISSNFSGGVMSSAGRTTGAFSSFSRQ